MKITLLSLFPDLVESYFTSSIMQKAVQKGIVEYSVVDIRKFSLDKHKTCDDYPYGGGAGMVLKPEPLAAALEYAESEKARTIFPTPSGRLFTQQYAGELSEENSIILVCGRYEGIDQRIIDKYVDDEVSIGNYVISSGEIASLVVVDAVFRLIDGAISRESLEEESFKDGMLEYPHYTRPSDFDGLQVPEVLLSGNHAAINEWRLKKSLEKTARFRPELLEEIDDYSKKIFREINEKGDENGCN